MDDATDITLPLQGLTDGEGNAVDELLPLLYAELHSLARRALRRERPDHTLQPTALVNEAYLRLVGQDRVVWRNRAHFVAVAAQAIRRILIDHARMHRSLKRQGNSNRIPLDNIHLATEDRDIDLIALDEALLDLSDTHPRKAQVVELRFFGGLIVEEVAEIIGVAERSVERDWQFARAWLFRKLTEKEGGTAEGCPLVA